MPKNRKHGARGRKTGVKSLSIDPETLKLAKDRAKKLGFRNSFSAYIVKLISDDLKEDETGKAAADALRDAAGGELDKGQPQS
jgi:hypothetical protein